ncbi:phosphate ABC transporter substrate-binding protein PstS [Massilia solisilvae]|uniref:Phosphate-binding protein PstS n=2 Tax=Massilia solisilvae TaxID=1811225 RepID=A0ABT2BPY8_9BURK|nr:phosphate ABC transporter substrate-binding protein PstS [Massilia solisilvae]MCS0610581.1 phosphate ABC transporter substrate-binding protein PstS [Massilia solisilvae]
MNMKLVLKSMVAGVAAAVAMSSSAMAADITGAGSSFAYPIYSKWAEAYKDKSGVGLNYQSIGSGAGIKQIKAKTVDFGASDMPLSAEELQADGLVQFPTIMGGVVAVVNLDGIAPGQLKLSGPILADIFLGKVTKWNAPAIAALNPGVKLPDADITVVHRADGSGTSFLFTDFLSKTSTEWKDKVGAGTAVKWATGVGGKGNDGVAANVQRIKGSIGYVEWAYSKKNKMSHTQLKNHDGQFLQPDDDAFKAAAANAAWDKTPGYAVVLTNQPGKNAWPITGATFVLMHKTQQDAAKGKEVLKFFEYAFKNGAAAAEALDYVPMPASVTKMIEGAWKSQLKDAAGKPVL